MIKTKKLTLTEYYYRYIFNLYFTKYFTNVHYISGCNPESHVAFNCHVSLSSFNL